MGKSKLRVLVDRGYFSGPDIRACELAGITAYVPNPLTSASRKKGSSPNATSSTSPEAMSIVMNDFAFRLLFDIAKEGNEETQLDIKSRTLVLLRK
jgi:hypothetical protein